MKKLKTDLKFKGIIIDAYESQFKNGEKNLRIEQVTHPGGVCVAAITKDNTVLLVKQYRFGIEKDLIEFPAGLIDPGEDPMDTARRELQEETGYLAHHIEGVGHLHLSPGYSNEITYLYFAKDLEYVGTNFDENEEITIIEIPLETFYDMCDTNQFTDAKTVALAYYLQNRTA